MKIKKSDAPQYWKNLNNEINKIEKSSKNTLSNLRKNT